MRSYVSPANSTDEVFHSNSLIFSMRYGPCVKTIGTAHAKLERDTELCGDDFPK